MSDMNEAPTLKKTLLAEKNKSLGNAPGTDVPADWRAYSTVPPKWACQIIGISLTSYYEAVQRGEFQEFTRRVGRRLVATTQGLRRWLGELPDSEVVRDAS